ncbi:hypothetical protein BDP27DRAFT_1356052 [Rhodocollybia butyracea]|uniref:Uncharacterized protein n=1 Tax=Rhodocollybia butyracea TaxID=206335 RepID=A0A9P5P5J6_9AGAR|nr:hypothetical protein BDP27DRAFT_1356052 [Rhodocollybia butyracea]
MGPSTSTTSARATEAKFERKAQGDEYKGVGAAVSGGFNTIMSSTSSGHGRGAVNIVGGDGGASRGESIGANANVGRNIWARSLAHLLV